jgi:hypothetical protein
LLGKRARYSLRSIDRAATAKAHQKIDMTLLGQFRGRCDTSFGDVLAYAGEGTCMARAEQLLDSSHQIGLGRESLACYYQPACPAQPIGLAGQTVDASGAEMHLF